MNEKRFWDKVKIGKQNECWLWRAGTSSGGYGRFKIDGRLYSAHRVAYALVNGPIPKGLQVLHKCDNPQCVNPFHLFLGSNSDNMKDAYRKGRIKHLKKIQGKSHPPLGEDHHSAKLTENDVREIRRCYRTGEMNGPELARKYGVCHTAIYKIIHYQNWKRVS